MTFGQITINELDIIECDFDPSIVGLSAPVGSLALLDGGARKWQKFGPNATDWKEDNVAIDTSFDNTTNGFASNEVQHAIEEVRTYGEGFPRAGVPLTYNGTVTSGNWISYTELIATPRILFPVKIRIKEITWVNTNTNLGAFTFEFYKNGQVNPTNLVYTYTPTAGNRTSGYGYSAELNIDYDAGDSLFLRYVKPSGTSLSDLGFILWIARWG